MTRLDLVFAFEECEYNIKKIEVDSYVPSRQVYCEVGGAEKLGDEISLFFKKMKNNMKDMRDKAKIRRKYYLKSKKAYQNQKKSLANLDNDKPRLYPDVAEYSKVANYGIVKMTEAIKRLNSKNYEKVSEIRDAFMDLNKLLNSLSSDLTTAMKPVRLMYPKDYADSILDLKKNGIDIIELGIRFDELVDIIRREAITTLNNAALDLEFREKYSRTAKDIASELSKTQLTMVKNISTLTEFQGVKK